MFSKVNNNRISICSIPLLILAKLVLGVTPLSVIRASMRANFKSSTNLSDLGKFGIRKIYATKDQGREWFLNMDNPFDDNYFSSTFDKNITRQLDGGWKIISPAVRLNVNTPPGLAAWKNVEITGYAKIVSFLPYNDRRR